MAAAQLLDDHKSDSATPLVADIEGKWTDRSFHNRPEPVGDDAEKALRLIFAEAEFTLQPPSGSALEGKIDWPGGGLDLRGTIRPGVEPNSFVVNLVGSVLRAKTHGSSPARYVASFIAVKGP